MPEDAHDRARRLIDEDAVEGIGEAERQWLDAHLETCAACATRLRLTEGALGVVRSTAVDLPQGLAFRTQFRVGLRVQERHAQQHGWALWVSFALSWALGIASAPLVWRGFAWFGQVAGVSPGWLKAGFVLWWGVPAAITAAAVWALEKNAEER